MKIISVALVALLSGCLLGACNLGSQDDSRIAKLQAQVDALSRDVQTLKAAQHAATALTVQERCQADATRNFKLMGWSDSHPVGGATATFFSHYNGTLGHCLMVLQTTSTISPYSVITVMYDANEQAEYGSMDVIGDRVITCDTNPPGTPAHHCSSRDAFNKYLVKYMGFTAR